MIAPVRAPAEAELAKFCVRTSEMLVYRDVSDLDAYLKAGEIAYSRRPGERKLRMCTQRTEESETRNSTVETHVQ